MTEKLTFIKFIKIIGIILILIISKPEIGQSQHYFSLGGKRWGTAFGIVHNYNGIRLGLFDFESESKINGFNLCLINSNIYKINGITIAPINKVSRLNGLQLGFLNMLSNYVWANIDHRSEEKTLSNALQIGISNFNSADLNGLQTGFLNFNQGNVCGLQISLFNRNYCLTGLGIGLINICKHNLNTKYDLITNYRYIASCNGIQLGIINITPVNKIAQLGLLNHCNFGGGIQIGFINFRKYIDLKLADNHVIAEPITFQIGLLNNCSSGKSIQLGILNFRKNNVWFAKVLPIINYKFEKKKKQIVPADENNQINENTTE